MASSQRAPLGRSLRDHAAVGILPQSLIPRVLTAESMGLLLDQARVGERTTSRTIISRTLNVNDVVAEYCLRHLEEKLRDEKDYAELVLLRVSKLIQSTPADVQSFLSYAFGVQGMVSRAIVNHMRSAHQGLSL